MMTERFFFANDCGGFPSKWYCQDNRHLEFTAIGDVVIVAANVIRILLQFGGALAVIFIIYGGILYVISTCDPGRISKAKETISQAVIGLIISIAAYGIVTFIAGRF